MQETQETWFQSLGKEDPLEKEMATHSSRVSGIERKAVFFSGIVRKAHYPNGGINGGQCQDVNE